MLTITTPDEMFDLGIRIGSQLKAGDLLLLNGPLGAGKTLLTQGIGAALGIQGITSPTFVISRVHHAKIPLIHVDAYRLLQSENPNLYLDDLDLDTEREGAITVVEWGGAEAARLSDERLEIMIDRTNDERLVTIVTHGRRWDNFSL
ncbi:MAG TPA: tRNA (adenosine(37)-N6)-threonylcarbamoyltransferase complex ATPase subunit type 1 TsaE [Candidatus Nanopelagicaceae bacterium]